MLVLLKDPLFFGVIGNFLPSSLFLHFVIPKINGLVYVYREFEYMCIKRYGHGL